MKKQALSIIHKIHSRELDITTEKFHPWEPEWNKISAEKVTNKSVHDHLGGL